MANLIVLVNGVRQKPNFDFYRSTTNNRLVIFNPNVTLAAEDSVNLFYLTNLRGIDNRSLGTKYKDITWTVLGIEEV